MRPVAKALYHLLVQLHLARSDPRAHLMAEGVEARAVVVQDDEALHVHPFLQNRGQQLPQVVPTEGRRVIVVVVRNEAAHRHAGVQIE